MSSLPSADPGQPAAIPARTPLKPSGPFRLERVLVAVIGLLIATACWVTRDYWAPASLLHSRHETAPDGLSFLKFGTTRKELLETLAAAGNSWNCIVRPGMAPNAWVSHSNVQVAGNQLEEFSVLFSDGQRYDYGALPGNGAGTLGVQALLGSQPPSAQVIAIRAKLPRNFVEANSEIVPASVLRELGLPHSEKPDIVGQGKLFEWNWPNVAASYLSFPGQLSIEMVKEAASINVYGGPGNLPSMGPPQTPQDASREAATPETPGKSAVEPSDASETVSDEIPATGERSKP